MFLRYILLLIGSFYSIRDDFTTAALEIEAGYTSLNTANFDIQLSQSSQTLASLKAKGSSFDFLPFDLIQLRSANGQYHIGDVTFKYRESGQPTWKSGDSAASRNPVATIPSNNLAAANLAKTLPSSPLNFTREWTDVNGDLGLILTMTNTGTKSLEIGSLGFPLEFNSIFTGRTAEDTQSKCSLHDPYIGLDAGYLQVTPLSGTGPALVVTPIGNTPFQAWRNLNEPYVDGTNYGTQTFEGFYEWQTLSLAYAQNEWKQVEPWNVPTSKLLNVGQSVTFGLRFSLTDSIRGIEKAVKSTGTPFAVGVPGYVVPSDLTAQLHLFATSNVASIITSPANAIVFKPLGPGVYSVTPAASTWGRVRATISYSDGRIQTVHYYITKSGPNALKDVGNFATTTSWFTDSSDPFKRAPAPISYDRNANAQVKQDSRVWIAGLSDEAGAGTYIAATMKQAAQPNAAEMAKLEAFVDQVLSKRIQNPDFSVKKSIFYHDTAALPSYAYNTSLDWTSWTSWNLRDASATNRAYNYVHPIAAYWAMYRAGRAYTNLLSVHTWDWYLNQAYQTIVALMKPDRNGNCCLVGYALVGLMEETVIGEVLKDLIREGWTVQANNVIGNMSIRATHWETLTVPFGSEMAWDSTGQEGVYYWAKYFGHTGTATKAINSIVGYMPSIAHWGWNGNARRYWDNIYGGKLQRIERQIHHYGSGLNSLPILSHFRSNPTDAHLLRIGYGGMNGPLTNIDKGGFGAASFHSWPSTLAWDGYSGDYGPNHLGLILGSGTYVAQDNDLGLVAYGGELVQGSTISVTTKEAVRRRVFIGPLGLFIELDAGVIQNFTFSLSTKVVTLTLTQLSGVPIAAQAILWLETTVGNTKYTVSTAGLSKARGGWSVPLNGAFNTVTISPL